MMVSGVFKSLQENWNDGKMGVRMRAGERQQQEYRASVMIFTENCCLFLASKEEIRKMIVNTTEDWKEGQSKK